MTERHKIYQTADEILQEIENFGKYKTRKGSPHHEKALGLLKENQVIIQSRRENSPYWYPGVDFDTAQSLGASNFFKTNRKRKMHFHLRKVYDGKNGRFITGLLIGFVLGALIFYFLL